MGKLFTDVEAAEILSHKVQTLRNWRFNGKGPAYLKMGRSIRYTEKDLETFMEENRVVPTEV